MEGRLLEWKSIFDEDAWALWEPPTKKRATEEWSYGMKNGVKDVVGVVDDFDGIKGDAKCEEITYYGKIYRDMLSLFSNDVEESSVKYVVLSLQNEFRGE